MVTSRILPELTCVCYILLVSAASLSLSSSADYGGKKLYIVYMGSLPGGSYSPESHHLHILQSVVTESSEPGRSLYRSYGRSFNGFAAWLTEREQEKLSKRNEILSIFPSQPLQLHTTRSWDFMGLTESSSDVGNRTDAQSDMIIGVLDSGIWPDSESFRDDGFGPVPKKWKGACKGGANFTCNRKIVGARWYVGQPSARDVIGHGTHTASIAAGNRVKGASFYNLAGGTARGGVPSSRIAVYVACCRAADLLAGFDDAIADGVDVITISIGYTYPVSSLLEDPISIGSFHAMANNIATVNSAGNSGPYGATIYVLSPWVVSVGASSIDRKFDDKVVLADGTTLTGISVNSFTMGGEPKYPLIYGKKFNSSCNDSMSKLCAESCLDKDFLRGKILMCNDPKIIAYPKDLIGAAGLITSSDNVSYMNQLPGLALSSPEFEQLVNYYTNTKKPRATILKSEAVKDDLAPVVAQFSARGPNTLFPEIMKPDVVAPGVNILAAFPPNIPPSGDFSDARRVKYNIMSGTSMACPHAAGAIGYLKSLHPGWSPSSLKSALMTTARPLNASLHSDREFAYGSGHIDPVRAADPGLVFDISKKDYMNFLCNAYDNATCHKISGADCRCLRDKTPLTDFNYPALAARTNNGTSRNIKVNFTRTVTNVGHPNSTYKAEVTADPNLEILVVPSVLSFKNLNEKRSFVVSVSGAFPSGSKMLSSLLVWGDGDHIVRSPIVIYAADFVQTHE